MGKKRTLIFIALVVAAAGGASVSGFLANGDGAKAITGVASGPLIEPLDVRTMRHGGRLSGVNVAGATTASGTTSSTQNNSSTESVANHAAEISHRPPSDPSETSGPNGLPAAANSSLSTKPVDNRSALDTSYSLTASESS